MQPNSRVALAEGARRFVAVGGDGTVNETLNGLLDFSGKLLAPDIVLCPIPAGTANELSRALGHLASSSVAYDAAASRHSRVVDLLKVRCASFDGRVVERFGYLIVSLGVAASVSHRTSRSRWAKKLGEIAYVLMAPGVILGFRLREVAIAGGRCREGDEVFVHGDDREYGKRRRRLAHRARCQIRRWRARSRRGR